MKIPFFATLCLVACGLTACNNDDEFVSLPSGIVMLTESVHINPGDTFEIYFRTNPSTFDLVPERVQLDCVNLAFNSQVSVEDDPSQGDPNDLFRLLSVRRTADPTTGTWVAEVSVREMETLFAGTADLYLVVAGSDQMGSPVVTSFGKTAVSIYPPLSDKVLTVRSPYLQSYKIYHPVEKYLPASITLSPAVVDNFRYNLDWLAQVDLTTDSDNFTITRTDSADEIRFTITPAYDFFGWINEREYSADFRLTLVDRCGNVSTQTRTIRFFNSMYTIAATEEFTCTHAQLNQSGNWLEYEVDMSSILPQLGLLPAIYDAHPNLAVTLATESFNSSFDADHPFMGFDLGPDFTASDHLTAADFSAVPLLNTMNDQHPAGSYYAVLYITMADPTLSLMTPMLCIEVRQEIKITE